MANPGPYLLVPAPEMVEGIGTLLTTFEPIPTPDEHWELGYEFQTWGACLRSFSWGPCSGVIKEPGQNPTNVQTVPVTVYAPFQCSTWGWSEDEYKAAALDALRWTGGQALEAELWAGTIAQQNGWPNQYLTSGETTIISPGDVFPWPVALALLQKSLRNCMGDGAGVIHASAALVSMWHMARAVSVVDGILRDAFGNFVIAGAGYTGGAPVSDSIFELSVDATGGDYTLTLTSPITGEEETTAPILFGANAAAVLAALEGLTIVEPGDVTVVGDPNPGPSEITFTGRFSGQDVTFTVDGSNLTGGGVTLTETTAGGSVETFGEEWAYATSIIDVRVGDVQIIDPDTVGSIDRSTNSVTFYAETTMSATWDGCCQFGIAASLADACTFPT